MPVDWSLLQQANPGAAFQQGLDTGRTRYRQQQQDNALALLAKNPQDETAISALAAFDPAAAMQLHKFGTELQSEKRQGAINAGLSQAYDPNTGSIDPVRARNAYLGQGDVSGAMAFDQSQGAAQKDKLETLSKVNEAGLQLLGGVTDQASYTAAIGQAQQMYQQFGVPFPQLPPEYHPDTVRQLQMRALSAKDQLAAQLDDRKFTLDQRDKEADNARADRLAASSIANDSSQIGTRAAANSREAVRFKERGSGGGNVSAASDGDLLNMFRRR